MKKSLYGLLICAFFACTSNAKKEGKSTSENESETIDTLISKSMNTEKLDTSDVSFFQNAAYGGMIEVESSNKILTGTKNSAIKAFADMMVKDHSGVNEKLKILVLNKGYVLPTALPESKMGLIGKMDSFKDEGKNEYYLQLMVNEHENAIGIFSRASRSADKEINSFASSILPLLKQHYAAVKKIDSLFKLPKTNQGDDPLKLSDRNK